MRLLLVLAVALLAVGCSWFSPRIPTVKTPGSSQESGHGALPPAEPKDETSKEKELRRLRDERDRLTGKLAELEPKIKDQEAAVAQEKTAWLRWLNMVLAGLAVVAIPLCVGLAIWLQSKLFWTGAVAAIGVLVSTMATNWILTHTTAMLWVAGGVAVLGLGGLLFHLWRNRKGLFGAIRAANALKPLADTAIGEDERKKLMAAAAGKATTAIDSARKKIGF